MEDYPRTLAEFEARFATEEACLAYLEALRWPEGFRCPRCGGADSWRGARGLWICRSCQRQSSVTAGTIFQGTRKDFRDWFRAMWWVCGPKSGLSALGMQRILGLGSYETAWTWLHKLRRAMVRPGREQLSGVVEVDETALGGPKSRHGRKGFFPQYKTLIMVAAEQDGPGIGRIRLSRIPSLKAVHLLGFVQRSVAPGSTVHTDGKSTYARLDSMGYRHRATLRAATHGNLDKLLPRVHRVASLLKRWLMGTHQGAVQAGQIGFYLDEFTFRFNRRQSRSRGKLFYRLAQQAVQVGPAPYAVVAQRPSPRKTKRKHSLERRG